MDNIIVCEAKLYQVYQITANYKESNIIQVFIRDKPLSFNSAEAVIHEYLSKRKQNFSKTGSNGSNGFSSLQINYCPSMGDGKFRLSLGQILDLLPFLKESLPAGYLDELAVANNQAAMQKFEEFKTLFSENLLELEKVLNEISGDFKLSWTKQNGVLTSYYLSSI